jgi:transcriptional regulator GlxA family with amidase domain
VAEASGFFDQAHLANEIRLMAGLTPTELRGHGAGGVFED